jgi:hypothetical protein
MFIHFADIILHIFRILYARRFGSWLYCHSQVIGCLMAISFCEDPWFDPLFSSPDLGESIPHPIVFLKIYFSIIPPCIPRFWKWSHSFNLPTRTLCVNLFSRKLFTFAVHIYSRTLHSISHWLFTLNQETASCLFMIKTKISFRCLQYVIRTTNFQSLISVSGMCKKTSRTSRTGRVNCLSIHMMAAWFVHYMGPAAVPLGAKVFCFRTKIIIWFKVSVDCIRDF